LVDWMQIEMAQGRNWDRVYTAKMMHSLCNGASDELKNANLLIIHTGGLQGNASLALAHP
jgi:1-aminocyclopropane-1-carboxylate deaminase/D-cysteine desulfhydrase-like pyridoxal-dependent ACC family enzyme